MLSLRRSHPFLLPLKFISACLFCALAYHELSIRFSPLGMRSKTFDVCKLISVEAHPFLLNSSSWAVSAVSTTNPVEHSLHIEHHYISPHDIRILKTLDGCKSISQCKNTTVPCKYNVGDPSDAFWIRDYNNSTKFVVIFRVGLASLFFFIASIISDGSIFYPHRPGFSVFSGSVLIMIGLASLIYVLIVPRNLQLSLYGAGPWQTTGYICLVTLAAALLPAIAIIWVNSCVFLIFFIGFLFEQLLYAFMGIMHFFGVLTLYQAQNTFLHLRLIYLRDIAEVVDFDHQLVVMSNRFLGRVRQNWYLRRVPTALDEDALQMVENLLPEHLLDEISQEDIPEIDFEALEEPTAQSQPPAEQQEVRDEENTPLLRQTTT